MSTSTPGCLSAAAFSWRLQVREYAVLPLGISKQSVSYSPPRRDDSHLLGSWMLPLRNHSVFIADERVIGVVQGGGGGGGGRAGRGGAAARGAGRRRAAAGREEQR